MDIQHVNLKLHLRHSGTVDLEPLIPIFHDWVREQSCEETLVDVADYRHVPAGPGILLVGHEADFSLDWSDNRLGVRYNRKARVAGENHDRFRQALRAALMTCRKLEEDGRLDGKLGFESREFELGVNDRLLAPNCQDTYASLSPEIGFFCDGLFGRNSYSVTHQSDPRRRFSVLVQTPRPMDRDGLLEALSP
ncbi:MAG: hypothetical protein OXU26_09605 [Acidobacteriota bacterium]|nr:hypothetical protein [Acidobacteriota bacterium]